MTYVRHLSYKSIIYYIVVIASKINRLLTVTTYFYTHTHTHIYIYFKNKFLYLIQYNRHNKKKNWPLFKYLFLIHFHKTYLKLLFISSLRLFNLI